jgi:hypothetical protein
MRADSASERVRKPLAETALFLCALTAASCLCGCSYLPERLPYEKLAAPYNRVQLRRTTSLDALNLTRGPGQIDPNAAGRQLLTQSDTAIAVAGRSKDGLKSWANLIVFDDYRMTAVRKYFIFSDENATISPTAQKYYLIPARKGLLFDGQFVLDPDILTTPYATDEAKQIATVRWLSERLKADVRALSGGDDPARGDETVSTLALMMNQVFGGILHELAQSPGLARRLAEPEGVPFPHISMNEGRIQMVTVGEFAAVKIRVNLPMVSLWHQ